MRRVAAAVAAAAVLSACGGGSGETATPVAAQQDAASPTSSTSSSTITSTSTSTSTTTTTIDPKVLEALAFEADKKLIKQLWRAASDASMADGATAARFTVDNAHPQARPSYEQCLATEGHWVSEWILRDDTIERDDGWAVPGGVGAGVVPSGTIYIMKIDVTGYPRDMGSPSETELTEAHVAVLDGRAWHFPACERR